MIALCYNTKWIGVLKDPEFFQHRKEERCARTFGTTNIDHPYIKVNNNRRKNIFDRLI